MFTLLANRRNIYVAALKAERKETDKDGYLTGAEDKIYDRPAKYKVVVSQRTGNAFLDPFGLDLDYGYTFVDDTAKQRFAEGSLLWIDAEPCNSEADYMIVAARRGLSNTIYAAKKL